MAFCACTEDSAMYVPLTDKLIQFEAKAPSSRGFIDSQNIATNGTKLNLYGFHDNDAMELEGKPLTYTNVNGENHWKVMDGATPQQYFWEESGDYTFYGWLAYDAAGSLSIPEGWTYDGTTRKLTIPETEVGEEYNQFDFVYSDVYVRDLDQLSSVAEKYATVPLTLNHLFSAFSIGAKNTTNEDVTITKIAIEGIHQKGSAVLDYSQNPVTVTYDTSLGRDAEVPFMDNIDNEYEEVIYSYRVAKENGVIGDAFFGGGNKVYHMIWPQKKEVVSPTNPIEGDDNRKFLATDSLLVVEYTMGGIEYKKRVKFPDMAWEAGKKYHFDIQFADKMVELKATVNPWNYTSSFVDFMDNSVTVKESGRLKWDETTCSVVPGEKKVYVSQGQPIKASFTLDAPTGGQWRVSLEGDAHAFAIIDDVLPFDDAVGPIDGKEHTIRITPKISNPERDYVVKLKFVVLAADGKVISADDVIQDKDGVNTTNDIYELILPSVN